MPLTEASFSRAAALAAAGEPEKAAEEALGILEKASGPSPRCALSSLLIGGWARVGKSLLAEQLEQRLGYARIRMDLVRSYFWKIEDAGLRFRCTQVFYERVCERWPSGVAVEGTNVWHHLQAVMKLCEAEGLDPRTFLPRGVPVVMLGAADARPEDKARQLIVYSDSGRFRPRYDDEAGYLRQARKIVAGSKVMRFYSKVLPVTYIEMDALDFPAALEHALARVSGLVQADRSR